MDHDVRVAATWDHSSGGRLLQRPVQPLLWLRQLREQGGDVHNQKHALGEGVS